jgi:hypothetical protein
VRRLGALIHRQALLAGIPVSDNGARLVGHAGVTAEHEGRLHDRIAFGECFIRIAGDERTLEGQVVAKLGMDDRSGAIESGFCVGYRKKRLVVDIDQRASVFGLGAALGHDRAHRFSLPAGAVHRDSMLRRRFNALQVRQHPNPGGDHFGELGPGDNGHHTGRRFRLSGFDGFDARVRVRRSQKRNVHHPRQYEIADILAAPLRQPVEIGPRYRPTDIGIRAVEGREAGHDILGDFHLAIARVCATCSIASTIA